MRLAGQRGQGGGNFGEAGVHIGSGGAGLAAAVGVAGVGAGDRVAEVPLTGRERITNRVEYLSSYDGAMRLPALVAASLRLP
jgi:hypothetical protein